MTKKEPVRDEPLNMPDVEPPPSPPPWAWKLMARFSRWANKRIEAVESYVAQYLSSPPEDFQKPDKACKVAILACAHDGLCRHYPTEASHRGMIELVPLPECDDVEQKLEQELSFWTLWSWDTALMRGHIAAREETGETVLEKWFDEVEQSAGPPPCEECGWIHEDDDFSCLVNPHDGTRHHLTSKKTRALFGFVHNAMDQQVKTDKVRSELRDEPSRIFRNSKAAYKALFEPIKRGVIAIRKPARD